MVSDGYAKGVPMGQHLKLDNDIDPEFLIWALKDVDGANLDRIQIIKGWEENGQLKEVIYDAIIAENPVSQGDNIVDLATGAIDMDKGEATLFTIWRDSDFDVNLNAFYYLRVLEVPTPRYTLWMKSNMA